MLFGKKGPYELLGSTLALVAPDGLQSSVAEGGDFGGGEGGNTYPIKPFGDSGSADHFYARLEGEWGFTNALSTLFG